jgi:hypothetical protein
MHALPYYAHPDDIAHEERERLAALGTDAASLLQSDGQDDALARARVPKKLPRINRAWDFGVPKK